MNWETANRGVPKSFLPPARLQVEERVEITHDNAKGGVGYSHEAAVARVYRWKIAQARGKAISL